MEVLKNRTVKTGLIGMGGGETVNLVIPEDAMSNFECDDCGTITKTAEAYDINGAEAVCLDCRKKYTTCSGCGGHVFKTRVSRNGLCSDCVGEWVKR